MTFPLRPLTCALAVALAAGMAAAQEGGLSAFGADTGLPVEISADSLQIDREAGTAQFSGNVVVGQGDLKLSAGSVAVTFSEESREIVRIRAEGGVTVVTETEAAEAQSADYALADGVLILSGDVLLSQDGSAIAADRMVIDLDTGTAQLEGRVRTVLQDEEAAQ